MITLLSKLAPIAPMISAKTLALLSCIILPIACSGGSGSSVSTGQPQDPGVVLLVTTAGGIEQQLSGRLALVAFEDIAGEISGNVLRGNPRLDLLHPLGAVSGVELDGFPPGMQAAVHLMFIDGSLTIRLRNGEERLVEIPAGDVRIPFAEAVDLQARGQDWLMLNHTSIDLSDAGNGAWQWTPSMQASANSDYLLEDVEFEVRSLHAPTLSGFGELSGAGRMIVEFVIAEDAILQGVQGADLLSPSEFLADLGSGAKLLLTGFLDGSELLVLSALALEPGDDPDPKSVGNKSDMSGTILELLPDDQTFRFEVFAIKKSGRGVPNELPLELLIDASDTKIKWVPRLGRHTGHLPFDGLVEEMFVEIEWLGPTIDRRVPDALKVDIRSERRPPMLESLVGVITELRLDDGIVVFEQDGGVSGELVLGAETVILRRLADRFERIDSIDLVVGQNIAVLVSQIEEGSYDAALIRMLVE